VRILFDQGTPVPLRRLLNSHAIKTAFELEWSTLENGQLIASAESEGFELLITTDTNLKYQQNLSERKIAILVLSTPSWPRIRECAGEIEVAISKALPGSYIDVKIP
jgi:hypothetical protein